VQTPNLRLIFAFGLAVACGIFLAIASEALGWSNASIATVGFAMAALLGLLGTPLVLLPLAAPAQTPQRSGLVDQKDDWRTSHIIELDSISIRLNSGGPQVQFDTDFHDWTRFVDPASRPDRLNYPHKPEGLMRIETNSSCDEPIWDNEEQNQFEYDFQSYLKDLALARDNHGDLDQEDEVPMVGGAN
jgi:hypothetical protein